MKNLAMIVLVLVCLTFAAVPLFACESIGIEGGIEGHQWGNLDLSSSPKGISFGINTGSAVTGYATMTRTGWSLYGNADMNWYGGSQIEAVLDLGNVQIYSNTWHNTNMSINLDP